MSIVTNLRYTANLDKGVTMTPITPSFLGGDQEAHRFVIDCYRQNSREAVDLSGVGVTGYFIRADGVTIPIVGETENNQASVLLPAACYAKQGRFSLVIKLSLDDGTADSIATVFWGEGAVSRSRTDVVIDPDSVIPSLEELLAQIQAMEIATEAANASANNANQAATDATNTANAAAASAQATAEAAATQAVEIATAKGDEAVQVATDKGNEAVQIATEQVEAQNQAIAKIAADLLTKAPAIECEASGSLVTVTDAAAQPAVQLVTHIEPVQEGEGDPSPDNVRPISGWDKVTAQRAGKNLANVPETITFTQGVSIWSDTPAGSYIVSCANTSTTGEKNPVVDFLDKNNAVVATAENLTSGTVQTVNLNRDAAKIVFYANGYSYANSAGHSATIEQFMVSKTEGAYEPYQGQTLTANLPETVYSGTLDWGTGVLTVDMHPMVYDGSDDERWGYDGTVFYQHGLYMPVEYKKGGKVISTHYLNDTNAAQHIRLGESYGITVRDVNISSLEDFLSALNTSPMTAAYELAEPYTIQLTPQQLTMLRGTTNLWSNTGDTDLVYVADTKLYIDQAIKAALNTTAEE